MASARDARVLRELMAPRPRNRLDERPPGGPPSPRRKTGGPPDSPPTRPLAPRSPGPPGSVPALAPRSPGPPGSPETASLVAPSTPPKVMPLPAATFSPGGASVSTTSTVVARPLGDAPPPPPPPVPTLETNVWTPRSPGVFVSAVQQKFAARASTKTPKTRRREVLAAVTTQGRAPLRDWTNVPRDEVVKKVSPPVVTALDSGSLKGSTAYALAADSPRSAARRRFEDAAAAAAERELMAGEDVDAPAPPAAVAPSVDFSAADASWTEFSALSAPFSPPPPPIRIPEWSPPPPLASECAWSPPPPLDEGECFADVEAPGRLYDVAIESPAKLGSSPLGVAKTRPIWRVLGPQLSPPRVVDIPPSRLARQRSYAGAARLMAALVAIIWFGVTSHSAVSTFWGLDAQKAYEPGTPVRLRGSRSGRAPRRLGRQRKKAT